MVQIPKKINAIKINNNLYDNEIKFDREKNNKCTEYEPYNNLGDDDCE